MLGPPISSHRTSGSGAPCHQTVAHGTPWKKPGTTGCSANISCHFYTKAVYHLHDLNDLPKLSPIPKYWDGVKREPLQAAAQDVLTRGQIEGLRASLQKSGQTPSLKHGQSEWMGAYLFWIYFIFRIICFPFRPGQ